MATVPYDRWAHGASLFDAGAYNILNAMLLGDAVTLSPCIGVFEDGTQVCW